MIHHQPNKKDNSPKAEPEKEVHTIPPGTEQETGLSRFIRTPDETPEEIKDARLNNLDEQEEGTTNDIQSTEKPDKTPEKL